MDSRKRSFCGKGILYFKDAEEDVDIKGIAPYDVSWVDVKEAISKACR